MSNPVHLLLLVGLIVGYLAPAILVAMLADRRGRSLPVYLLASLLVSWVVPLIVVMLLPARAPR